MKLRYVEKREKWRRTARGINDPVKMILKQEGIRKKEIGA